MTKTPVSPPPGGTAPPVFHDPRGHRRAIMIAAGVLVCLACLGVLAVAGGVLYADPHAPATGPDVAGRTNAQR